MFGLRKRNGTDGTEDLSTEQREQKLEEVRDQLTDQDWADIANQTKAKERVKL